MTRAIKAGDEEKILTEWEDDIVQRSAAIDRLEGLMRERPEEAPRVASMLTFYVRELSRQYPAKQSDRAEWLALVEDQDDSYPQWDETSTLHELQLTPDDVTIDALKTWANGLRPFRTDVEKAVQTLGRLGSIPKLAEARIVFDLRGANLQGFDLSELDFTNANLSGARLEGANLSWARFDSATNLTAALLRAAAVKFVDFSMAQISADQVNSTFGDGSTILPNDMPRPTHWPKGELDWLEFHTQWEKWRDDPAGYRPPEPEAEPSVAPPAT